MDFGHTQEQNMLRNMVREFAQREIIPVARKIDEEGKLPMEIIRKMGQLGLMGMTVPAEYGGSRIDTVSYMIALEELGRVCGSTGLTVEAHNSLGVGHIYEKGTEEQRRKYLPNLVTGKGLAAWALTEPNAGSDAASLETTAVLDGDEWVLNGSKQFITSGSIADVITIMAKTDKTKGAKGISAFIVEKGTDGLIYSGDENKMGLRGSVTSQLVLEDCRIPKENLLGEPGMGFIGAMTILDRGRTAIGALAVGLAQGVLDECLDYSKQRVQFGRPISSFQAMKWKMVDIATDINAARLLVNRAADMEDKGIPFGMEAAMAKLFASEMAVRAAVEGVQIHGGYGYTKEYNVERYFREVKLYTIGEGTSEVQRLVISKKLGL
ncbi:MAG: acyl-CoA dehydrogenase family protein [Candidatus Thermoplasmatota archaeon]|nr:acyl-CoA dehydrogenase family protein [Candidatus Thermoplasmatota archaeon]